MKPTHKTPPFTFVLHCISSVCVSTFRFTHFQLLFLRKAKATGKCGAFFESSFFLVLFSIFRVDSIIFSRPHNRAVSPTNHMMLLLLVVFAFGLLPFPSLHLPVVGLTLSFCLPFIRVFVFTCVCVCLFLFLSFSRPLSLSFGWSRRSPREDYLLVGWRATTGIVRQRTTSLLW